MGHDACPVWLPSSLAATHALIWNGAILLVPAIPALLGVHCDAQIVVGVLEGLGVVYVVTLTTVTITEP